MKPISKLNFSIGRFLATPAALAALKEVKVNIINLVERHFNRDWVNFSDEDTRLNDEDLYDRSRILSAYILPRDVKIWSITDAADDKGERAPMTVLLPEES